MDVVAIGPLRVASVIWQSAPQSFELTVVAKATYDLAPTTSRFSDHQEEVNEDDNHWNDDASRSVYAPNDLVPFKPLADVTLVGHAFAPRGEPVRSLRARLVVGDVDKEIEIFGERAWTREGKLREARFSKMPLRYERAAGGPETSNPVGMRTGDDALQDVYGNIAVPNLQMPGRALNSPRDALDPVGFGPIAPRWPLRANKLAQLGRAFRGSWSDEPLGDGFDYSFFNAAPVDQRVSDLRHDERILLENLHPEHPRLVTNLQGVRPLVFASKGTGGLEPVPVKTDALWIDTDRARCTMIWRARIPLSSRDERGRVVVVTQRPGERFSPEDVERLASPTRADVIDEMTADMKPEPGFDGSASTADLPLLRPDQALPFAPSGPPTPDGTPVWLRGQAAAPPPERPSSPKLAKQETLVVEMPSSVSPPTIATGLSAPQPLPPPAILPQPPPMMSSARDVEWDGGLGASSPSPSPPPPPIQPTMSDSPWSSAPLSSEVASAPPPPQVAIKEAALAPEDAKKIASKTDGPRVRWRVVTGTKSDGKSVEAPHDLARAASSGAVAASNAAARAAGAGLEVRTNGDASSSAPRAPMRALPRESLDLLWFDPACPARLATRWPDVIAAIDAEDGKSPSADEDTDEGDGASTERNEAHVLGILETIALRDAQLLDGISAATGAHGKFERPLVALAGELRFPFDEIEVLKATVTCVTPLIAGDKKLKETIDSVNELLQTPWLEGPTSIAERLTLRIREEFARGDRILPPAHLDAHIERTLIDNRHFQKRVAFGAPHLRGLFSSPGDAPVPAYLPEALGKVLPSFQTIKVRLIAELNPPQDQYEPSALSFRVVALARVVDLVLLRGSRA